MTDKEKKENLEELKDRKIEEEMLEDVAGGSVSGPIDIIGDDLSSPVAKKRRDN